MEIGDNELRGLCQVKQWDFYFDWDVKDADLAPN